MGVDVATEGRVRFAFQDRGGLSVRRPRPMFRILEMLGGRFARLGKAYFRTNPTVDSCRRGLRPPRTNRGLFLS